MVNTTVQNVGNTTANQTLTLAAGEKRITERHVRVEPGETRHLSLTRLNTSTVEPGRQLFIVSSATDDTLFSLQIEPREPLEEFISTVRSRSVVLRDSRIIDEDRVALTFRSDENVIDRYRDGSAEPVPQAAAFEMANNPDAPENVTLTLPGQLDEPRWQSTLSKSLAERYANQSLSPAEFRAELDENATGFESQFNPRFFPEEFTYATGDRARKAYVEELAQRLNNSTHGNLTVSDYGLFNETIHLPESTRTLGPNASLYIEFEMPQDEEQMDYRGFSSTDGGVRIFETIFKWGNLSFSEKHGSPPETVRLQFRNPDGQVHQTWDIPTRWSQKGAGGGVDGVLAVHAQVGFSSLTKHYEIE
ncbi:hypothetical protein [Salinibaculum salinum]|uniref:hypothetical protein n=1 Tax=Salinibaculum salinum TaxID=3131996 RepID=UPI0030EF756A